MLRRLWLLFAQATTLALAVLFVVATLRPQWLSQLSQGQGELRLIEPAQPELSASLLQSTSPAPASSLREAAAKAMPAVVYVFTRQRLEAPPPHPFLNDPLFRRFFGDQFPMPRGNGAPQTSGLGSGVIVSPEGYILTNHHVIEGSEQIEVALADGRRASARLVGTDPDTDLAVLKISLDDLPVIRFGRPSEIRVGDTVLAIGNPFGVGLTVTQGIVSALGRNQLNINTFENFIQTDAAINPGNSGGALVDANGDMVGINTAIYSRGGGSIGLGFAISADMAKQVMESLIRTGRVSRGFIGVELQDVNREIAESFKLPKVEGSIVAAVQNGGPADRAGIKAGDVVVRVNDQPSRNTAELLALVAALQPGQKAELGIIRNGRTSQYEVTVTERPARPMTGGSRP
ncbi:MAG: Do family serine endopeptidase [Burkholderiaceae bacterium]